MKNLRNRSDFPRAPQVQQSQSAPVQSQEPAQQAEKSSTQQSQISKLETKTAALQSDPVDKLKQQPVEVKVNYPVTASIVDELPKPGPQLINNTAAAEPKKEANPEARLKKLIEDIDKAKKTLFSPAIAHSTPIEQITPTVKNQIDQSESKQKSPPVEKCMAKSVDVKKDVVQLKVAPQPTKKAKNNGAINRGA